jgi:hypothetical protein
MAKESRAEWLRLHVLIQDGFKVSSAMENLNDQNGLFLLIGSIENQMFRKPWDGYPSQTCKSGQAKATERTAFRQIEQRPHGLINCLFQR